MPTLVILFCVDVSIVPDTSPVKLPSIFATNVPATTVISPPALPSASVNPIVNLLALRSQPINALFTPSPRWIKIPASRDSVVVPLDNMMILSLTSRFVAFIVVVVPLTTKLPVTVILPVFTSAMVVTPVTFNVPPTCKLSSIIELPAPLMYNNPPAEISLVTNNRLLNVTSSVIFGTLTALLSNAVNPVTAVEGIELSGYLAVNDPLISTLPLKLASLFATNLSLNVATLLTVRSLRVAMLSTIMPPFTDRSSITTTSYVVVVVLIIALFVY